jgi:hypothetical protein
VLFLRIEFPCWLRTPLFGFSRGAPGLSPSPFGVPSVRFTPALARSQEGRKGPGGCLQQIRVLSSVIFAQCPRGAGAPLFPQVKSIHAGQSNRRDSHSQFVVFISTATRQTRAGVLWASKLSPNKSTYLLTDLLTPLFGFSRGAPGLSPSPFGVPSVRFTPALARSQEGRKEPGGCLQQTRVLSSAIFAQCPRGAGAPLFPQVKSIHAGQSSQSRPVRRAGVRQSGSGRFGRFPQRKHHALRTPGSPGSSAKQSAASRPHGPHA